MVQKKEYIAPHTEYKKVELEEGFMANSSSDPNAGARVDDERYSTSAEIGKNDDWKGNNWE